MISLLLIAHWSSGKLNQFRLYSLNYSLNNGGWDSVSLEDFFFFKMGKIIGRIYTQPNKKKQTTKTSFKDKSVPSWLKVDQYKKN